MGMPSSGILHGRGEKLGGVLPAGMMAYQTSVQKTTHICLPPFMLVFGREVHVCLPVDVMFDMHVRASFWLQQSWLQLFLYIASFVASDMYISVYQYALA